MHVTSSTVTLAASHRLERVESERTALRLTTAPARPDRDTLELSPAARVATTAGAAAGRTSAAEGVEAEEEIGLDPRLRAMKALVEQLTGRRVRLLRAEDLAGESTGRQGRAAVDAPVVPGGDGGEGTHGWRTAFGGPAAGGWQLAYDHTRRLEESEHLTVVAHAAVTLADGSLREVSLELGMSRRFVEEHHVSLRIGGSPAPVDPLVITLDGTGATFGAGHLRFDLDLDGTQDAVRMTAGTSAYLVHDRDNDGRITDGSELFGPRTGDGFAELAAHDLDSNGWIDAADPIFTALRLAVPDGVDGVRLQTLAEAGVGAIGLRSIASPFGVRDGAELVGEVRATGLVLRSDGAPATAQHVDLYL